MPGSDDDTFVRKDVYAANREADHARLANQEKRVDALYDDKSTLKRLAWGALFTFGAGLALFIITTLAQTR